MKLAVIRVYGLKVKKPYTQIPNEAIRDTRIGPYEKVILFNLISLGRRVYPTYDDLRSWTGMSRERVWKSLKILEAKGMITIIRRRHRNKYLVHWSEHSTFHELAEFA